MRSFPLAPMSPLIRVLTVLLCLLPVVFIVGGLMGPPILLVPGLLTLGIDAGVWLFARPLRFEARPGAVTIAFPTWRRSVDDVAGARAISATDLRRENGLPLRVGVGGLWGGFGWLWTSRRGLIEFYISRTDGLVWIDRRAGRPLLVTPDDPPGLIATLAG